MAYEFIRNPEHEQYLKEKEKNVAGITKIGQHEVTEIKRDAAQVGCTRVTRAEVEQLLKQMDSAPRIDYNFSIEKQKSDNAYIYFTVRNNHTGWVSAQAERNADLSEFRYANESAAFCLDHKEAQKFFEFLGGALGYSFYAQVPYGPTVTFTKI